MKSKSSSGKEHYDSKIVFFDGVCNICNQSVDYILKKAKNNNLFIASLQSQFSQSFLSEELQSEGLDTFLYYNGKEFSRASEAVFEVTKELKGVIPFLIRLFRFLPRFITDRVYYIIAKNRYKLAGKRSACRIPTKEELSRFLE